MSKTPGLDRQGVRLREIPLDIGLANAYIWAAGKEREMQMHIEMLEGTESSDFMSKIL